MFTDLDHVGIATHSLDEAFALYVSVFGMAVVGREIRDDQGVEIALLRAGAQTIELLAPTRLDSPVGKFLAERGPGLHHLAFRVDDIVLALDQAREAGLELIDTSPRTGAGGHLVAFLHPRATGKVLIELLQHRS